MSNETLYEKLQISKQASTSNMNKAHEILSYIDLRRLGGGWYQHYHKLTKDELEKGRSIFPPSNFQVVPDNKDSDEKKTLFNINKKQQTLLMHIARISVVKDSDSSEVKQSTRDSCEKKYKWMFRT